MAPMSCAEHLRAKLAPHATTLHDIARQAIALGPTVHGISEARRRSCSTALKEPRASFVTLRHRSALRGCVGSADAIRQLADDVACNAVRAAYCDTRFQPLAPSEFAELRIEIAVLTALEPIPFADEAALTARLVPGRDGLCLRCDERRALFLPQVWRSLPDSRAFLDCLKDKAGLPPQPLAPVVRAYRFEVAEFV